MPFLADPTILRSQTSVAATPMSARAHAPIYGFELGTKKEEPTNRIDFVTGFAIGAVLWVGYQFFGKK